MFMQNGKYTSDIFNSFAISCNFNLQSAKMSLWNFGVFSGTTAKFGATRVRLYDRV